MNREDIIRMFHEAGESAGWKPGIGNQLVINYLTHFAALVAAAERNSWPAEMEAMERQVNILTDALAQERKAVMQLFTDPENQPTQHGTVTVEYLQREIAAEREACAKVCDALHYEVDAYGAQCAAAIRARGEMK